MVLIHFINIISEFTPHTSLSPPSICVNPPAIRVQFESVQGFLQVYIPSPEFTPQSQSFPAALSCFKATF